MFFTFLACSDQRIRGGLKMKIGRNAPCPCGSGKKYKKCCLNKGKEQYLAEAIMYSLQNIKRESQIKRC